MRTTNRISATDHVVTVSFQLKYSSRFNSICVKIGELLRGFGHGVRFNIKKLLCRRQFLSVSEVM